MAPGSDDLSHVHEPVLVQEVLAYLALERMPTGLVVDGTVGAGGHATAILHAHPETRLVGLDRDPEILTHAAARLAPFGDRAQLVHGSYADLDQVLMERALPAPAGILLDVGVSSLQLDDLSRGFSFKGEDALPDMRFDPTGEEQTAADLVNHASERELADILHFHGEEPRARAVARAIVHARPITTIGQLREVVRRSAFRVRRHDAATRSFQALRIAVNDELGHFERGLRTALEALGEGGRLVVLCFQSAEERLVKDAFREAKRAGRGRILTKKPVRATQEEIRRNPRARPARLRAFEVSENAAREGSK
ncbi:MAG: 16S rRNA (cytosine(1402)-N(4))-methyltransferase RsmH [Planctomycetota bacterium]|nr:16S rRNA (cytosine(1402)-N(4))-methyltransferase RsmH [Planctomycetota bacterium]